MANVNGINSNLLTLTSNLNFRSASPSLQIRCKSVWGNGGGRGIVTIEAPI